MIDLTALGGPPVLTLITGLVVGYLIVMRKIYTAGFVALSVSCGAILSTLIKSFLVRPRPELVPHLVHVSSPSFRSGHAMNSAIVYLTLAVLLARSEQRRPVQIDLVTAAITLTCLRSSAKHIKKRPKSLFRHRRTRDLRDQNRRWFRSFHRH